jgi:rare lipoprotein A
MNNKIVLLILTLTTSFFASVFVDNKPQQKEKKKEKATKVSSKKELDKSAAITIVDTAKTKLKNGLEIDSLDLSDIKGKLLKKNAHASYYHNRFNGRRTASGKRFDNNGYTAAHKKLPFGTFVKVTNETNGKSVIVEITDRGPFSKAREIDLSKRAFMDIASNKNSGVVFVTLEVIELKK